MIKVTRLDGRKLIVNTDLIENIEETPDTIIGFTTGRKIMVRESLDEVLEMVMEYRKRFPVYAVPTGGEGRKQRPDIHKENSE